MADSNSLLEGGIYGDDSLSSSCVVAVVTNSSNGPVNSNRNSILSDRIYGDDGSGFDEEILDMEDLLKTKGGRGGNGVHMVPTDLGIGTEIGGFHDIYDRKVVTFYGNEEEDEIDAKDSNNNHNNSSGSSKAEKRKSTSSHSSFSSSTSSGIISANNDEFKIIMKNNYECTLLMMSNDNDEDDGEEDEEDDQTLAEENNQPEENNGENGTDAAYHRNGFTQKTGQSLTDDEFKTSFNGGDNTDSGNDDHSLFFNNKSFVNGDGLTVLVANADDEEDHRPKCMKLILGWYSIS